MPTVGKFRGVETDMGMELETVVDIGDNIEVEEIILLPIK